MKYWEQMRSQYGFEHGGAVPADADERRELYVLLVNKLAAALGSNTRVIASDKQGYNWCRIVFIEAKDLSVLSVFDVNRRPKLKENLAQLDTAMSRAIEVAHDSDIDSAVTVKVKVDAPTAKAAVNAALRVAREKGVEA